MSSAQSGQDPFDLLPEITRLTAENVHRLLYLGGDSHAWYEEALTQVLRSHLAGADYVIQAHCPVCGDEPAADCTWASSSRADVQGGLRLTSKTEESRTFGADLLLIVKDSQTGREIRVLLQAKRVRAGERLDRSTVLYKRGEQLATLTRAAADYEAAPYYLFYVQAENAHARIAGTCRTHRSPQDCAAMWVEADKVEAAFQQPMPVSVEDLLQQGKPLVCLAGHCGHRSRGMGVLERVSRFTRQQPRVRKTRTDATTAHAITETVIDVSSAEPRHHEEPRTADGPEPGNVLLIRLGRWTPETGDGRRGYGWHPESTDDDVREATRRWWKLNRTRAAGIRYLVARARGETVGRYRVTSLFKEPHGPRIGFGVEPASSQEADKLDRLVAARLEEITLGRTPVRYL